MKVSKKSCIHATASVFSVGILTLIACGSVDVQQPEITETTLKTFFDTIESTGTNVVFTFKKYGKVVSVPCDSEFTVCDRHLSLSFMPMRNMKGTVSFILAYKKDFRSMGASVTTNSACLVSVSEPTEMTALTTQTTKDRCLYGLQLLPLAPQDSLAK